MVVILTPIVVMAVGIPGKTSGIFGNHHPAKHVKKSSSLDIEPIELLPRMQSLVTSRHHQDLSTFLEARVSLRLVEEIRRSPVDIVNIPLFTRSSTSQVVQDFFHQQYEQ